MIVTCEHCEKKYNVDPAKIKGDVIRFKCKACNQITSTPKPTVEAKPPPAPPAPADSGAESEPEAAAPKMELKRPAARRIRFGLRAKMAILFFIIPILIISGSGFLFLNQMETLSGLITDESSRVVKQFAERIIKDRARSVAAQVSLAVQARGNPPKTAFNTDAAFKGIAVQKVGKTGYTALYELPGPDNVWRTWAHVNAKIIGIDMMKLKKPLGNKFPGFWKVYSGVKGGKESRGYYTWQDKDGRFRDKFMVCTPVDGTRYIIAATTYLDEFTSDVVRLESDAKRLTDDTRRIVFMILGGTLLLIALIVSLYGHILIRSIKRLTQVAEQISVGELDAEVPPLPRDEIGALGEAIERMQDSLQLFLDRLRKR